MEGKMADTLYKRLGGYDAIAAVADDLLVRLQTDPRLARFWQHRSEDSLLREKQTLINFLCASAGGPLYYVGRDMKVSHKGLGIDESGSAPSCRALSNQPAKSNAVPRSDTATAGTCGKSVP